jgi:hypothetical protein
MLATHGPHWFDRRPPDSHWPGIGVSVAITAAVFAAALVSMSSVSLWIRGPADVAPPVMVPLPPLVLPTPTPRVTKRVESSKPVAPTTVPTEIAPPIATVPAAPPVVARTVAPTVVPMPMVVRTDTTARSAQPSIAPGIPLGTTPRTFKFGDAAPATGMRAGAPLDRAGVTYDARAANTVAVRDSIINTKMLSIRELLATHPMKGAELAELQQSQKTADRLARRATTAGNAADVHVMKGEGLGGAGAVGGGNTVSTDGRSVTVSIPFPLFSSGPSPAERKRNEKIDADNQLRLRRLQDLLLLKRDSIRADSLRRDSLARRKIIPEL